MNIPHKCTAILISGPTATGKTDFALQLGQNLPIEIVNADIGSLYTPLTIGTAKPDYQQETIPHHFFDLLDTPVSWTAPQFREKLQLLLPEIWSRGNIPVIVGGSAFYIQSFFYRNYELATPHPDIMAELEARQPGDLWEELHRIDPERALEIDPHDQYRLVRALAIWRSENKKPSSFKPIFDPLAACYFLNLTRDRDQLYAMIDQRVIKMIDAGWLDEVRSLLDDAAWTQFLLHKKMIGYDLLALYLMGHCSEQSFDEIVALIAQRTRNYAKRQITFLKKLAQNVELAAAQDQHFDLKIIVQTCNLSLQDVSKCRENLVAVCKK